MYAHTHIHIYIYISQHFFKLTQSRHETVYDTCGIVGCCVIYVFFKIFILKCTIPLRNKILLVTNESASKKLLASN